MPTPTYQETLSLNSSADPQACMGALKDIFESTARLKQLDETALEVSIGSRLAYRLFGVMLGTNVPVKLRFDMKPEGATTQVVLTMSSDAGWYLFGTTIAEQAYRGRFTEIVARLHHQGFTTAG